MITPHPIFSEWTVSKSISDFLHRIQDMKIPVVSDGKRKYYNIAAAFDIETTSFFHTCGKCAIMYVWTLAIGRNIVMGRTWEEFCTVCAKLRKILGLHRTKILTVYVHNLPYEFQFMRKWMKWDRVFAVDKRKPVYAITDGIFFKCSYILSGLSLANVAKTLKNHDIAKLEGELDYKKVRHAKTPLTDMEQMYCLYDVIIVIYYIEDTIDRNGNISKIPLTQTGYVRRYCRNSCFTGISGREYWKRAAYGKYIQALTLEPDEYLQLRRAFMGGFTHASGFSVGKIIENVSSYDFTSSYPAVMIAEKFPISRAEKVEIASKEEFEKSIKYYCCVFDCRFVNIRHKIKYEHYISRSRCWSVKGDICDNGRIVKAEELSTTITDQDYMIIRAMYDWDYVDIYNFRRYKRGYLPTDFVKSILKLYHDKTTLKGVDGMEDIYMQSKAMLNSTYGMAVTDIVRPEYKYNYDWFESPADLDVQIAKYNNSKTRFLFYPVGVWVTAYARRNLFSAIIDIGRNSPAGECDYLYADTDSVKITHANRHQEYFRKYNEIITEKVKKALEYHKISFDEAVPKNQKGVEKMIGVWDFDGDYAKFKTLGAKRYLIQDYDGHYKMTVAGLGKLAGLGYLRETYGDGIFDAFTDGMYVPADRTGKMTYTYIDDVQRGKITDYLGVEADFLELSGVHLEEAEYSLSMTDDFIKYLRGIWQ